MFAMRAAQALRALPRLRRRSKRSPPPTRARLEKDILARHVRRRSGRDTRRSCSERDPARGRARRARSEAQDGAGLPLVPRPVEPLGDRRRADAAARLPDLVRPGDGRVQRVGRAARSWRQPANRTVVQIALNLLEGAAVDHPRPAAPHATASPVPAGRLRFPPRRARLSASRRSSENRLMSEVISMTQIPIAVVGVSALFPGSTDAPGFWRDILAGRDLITDVPPTHWLTEDYFDPDPKAPDKTYAKRGGFLAGRLRPAGVRHPAEHPAGDRHVAAPRPDRRAAGARRRDARRQFADDRPRARRASSSASPGARSCSARW